MYVLRDVLSSVQVKKISAQGINVKLLQNKSVKLTIISKKIGEFLLFFARQLFLIRLGFH